MGQNRTYEAEDIKYTDVTTTTPSSLSKRVNNEGFMAFCLDSANHRRLFWRSNLRDLSFPLTEKPAVPEPEAMAMSFFVMAGLSISMY